jgi:hypothetical protein
MFVTNAFLLLISNMQAALTRQETIRLKRRERDAKYRAPKKNDPEWKKKQSENAKSYRQRKKTNMTGRDLRGSRKKEKLRKRTQRAARAQELLAFEVSFKTVVWSM